MKMIGSAIILIAIVLLSIGGFKALSITTYLKSSEVVPGTIIGYDRQESSMTSAESGQGVGAGGVNIKASTFPVVEYVTKGGETFSFTANFSKTSMPKGELEVIYYAASPNEGKVNSPVSIWIGAALPGIIGILLLLVGFIACAMLK